MSWFSVYYDMDTHPKTYALAEALDLDRDVAFSRLFSALNHIYKSNHDGSLGRLTAKVIEDHVRWDGAPGAFIQAMIDTGWLDADETGAPVGIHNASRYTSRHRETVRRRLSRENKRAELKNTPRVGGPKNADRYNGQQNQQGPGQKS